jgi:hypothetical protein
MIRRPILVVRTPYRVPGTNAGRSSLLSELERGSNRVGLSDVLTSCVCRWVRHEKVTSPAEQKLARLTLRIVRPLVVSKNPAFLRPHCV